MAEPSRTRTETLAPPHNPGRKKRRRCLAQDDFIRSTRQEIDAGACKAYNSDWTNILPSRSPRFSTGDRKLMLRNGTSNPLLPFFLIRSFLGLFHTVLDANDSIRLTYLRVDGSTVQESFTDSRRTDGSIRRDIPASVATALSVDIIPTQSSLLAAGLSVCSLFI
jgi:hypothetical protein